MRGSEIARVVDALQDRVGEPLAGVWQPERHRVILGLGTGYLLLVPRGPLARLHSVGRRPPNPARPYSFQGACRAHLRGRLTGLAKMPGDRVVDLEFGQLRLHLRLTGRGGGLWLVRDDAVVAAYDGPAPAILPTLPDRPPRDPPPRFAPGDDEDWDLAARRWFSAREHEQRLDQLRVSTRRDLRNQLARKQRLFEALEADLERAAAAPRLRRQGDALAARLHAIPRGVTHLDLPDLEDPDVIHSIELDPTRPPSATMEQIYRRARRLDRVTDRVLDHLARVEDEVAALRRHLDEVEEADLAGLRALASSLPRRSGGRSPATNLPWHVWTGPGGQRVLVGRNARSNRKLTFSHARGQDFWMHVRGRPAAHVVVPMHRGKTPDLQLLLAAAQIALVHAKVTEGESAEVQYTRIRNIRSIPGDDSGRVRVHDEKVLHVRRDAAALVGWDRT